MVSHPAYALFEQGTLECACTQKTQPEPPMKLFSRIAKTPPTVPTVGHPAAARRQTDAPEVGYEAALPFLSSALPHTVKGTAASSKWANWRRRWFAGHFA